MRAVWSGRRQTLVVVGAIRKAAPLGAGRGSRHQERWATQKGASEGGGMMRGGTACSRAGCRHAFWGRVRRKWGAQPQGGVERLEGGGVGWGWGVGAPHERGPRCVSSEVGTRGTKRASVLTDTGMPGAGGREHKAAFVGLGCVGGRGSALGSSQPGVAGLAGCVLCTPSVRRGRVGETRGKTTGSVGERIAKGRRESRDDDIGASFVGHSAARSAWRGGARHEAVPPPLPLRA